MNRNYYLNIVGYGTGGTLVTDQDKVWLVLEDGSVVKLDYRAELPYNETDIQNIYIHHYIITLEDIEILKYNKVTLFRIVSPTGNTDVALSAKNAKRFLKLSDIFLREVSKDQM